MPAEAEIDRICTPIVFNGARYTRHKIQKMGDGLRLLDLSSGPEREMDAVILAKVNNVQLDAVDILRHNTPDLADDYVWSDLMTSASSGFYSGYLMSPTCGTFSMARSGRGGPTPLRGENEPEIFGLANFCLLYTSPSPRD